MSLRALIPSWVVTSAATILVVGLGAVSPAHGTSAPPLPSHDSFYSYQGTRPLKTVAPGTVLAHRSFTELLAGIPTPFRVTQLLYRTTGNVGEPNVTVASVIHPLVRRFAVPRLVSYQYEYDALGEQCDPSYNLRGGAGLSQGASEGEQSAMTGFLLAGYTVVTSDYEGRRLDFGSAAESAHGVLDGIRAALRFGPDGLDGSTKVAMVGYSGGSFATGWAAADAARYAPELGRRMVGSAVGGIPVNLMHTLAYAQGNPVWAGAVPLIVEGVARSYRVSLDAYLSNYGRAVLSAVSDRCIVDVLGRYPGLRFADLMRRGYGSSASIPGLRSAAWNLSLTHGTAPAMPMFVATANLDGVGDGIVVAQDVRALVSKYCKSGLRVTFHEYDGMEHVTGFARFVPDALNWIDGRFGNAAIEDHCGSVH